MTLSMTVDLIHARLNRKLILKALLKLFSLFIGKRKILTEYVKYATKYEGTSTNYVGGIYTPYKKEYIETNKLLPTIDVEFEGRKYQAPACWDEFLRNMYNDYMKLPPANKRKTHGVTAWWI